MAPTNPTFPAWVRASGRTERVARHRVPDWQDPEN